MDAYHGAVRAIEHPHSSRMSDDAPPLSLSLHVRFFHACFSLSTANLHAHVLRVPLAFGGSKEKKLHTKRPRTLPLEPHLFPFKPRIDWERFRFNGSIGPFGFESGGKDEAHEVLVVALASARCIASKMAVFARTASELLREAVHAQELAPYDVRGRRMGARTGGNGRRMELTVHTVQSTQHHGVKTVLEEVEAHAKGMFEVTRCDKRMRRIEARANDGTDSTDEKWRRTARNKP